MTSRRTIIDLHELSESGWLLVKEVRTTGLLQLARELGEPVPSRLGGPLVDRLAPKPKEEAPPRSMSAFFGLGEFPFHTDCAHFRIPPRFLLLRLAEGATSDRPTLAQEFRQLGLNANQRNELLRHVWLVNGGRRCFFSSILSDSLIPGHTLVRYDQCCIRPALPGFAVSAAILEHAMHEVVPVAVDWKPDEVLIIDNWRVLHARGPATNQAKSPRVLERVLVEDRSSET